MTLHLTDYVLSARWFGGKGRDGAVTDLRRLATFGEQPVVAIELVTVTYPDGDSELYQLPLAYYSTPQDHLHHAYVGEDDDDQLGHVFVYDALHCRDATGHWLRAFGESLTVDGLVFHRLPGHDIDLTTHSTLFSGEQSNSSVAFGEDSLMKVFRKITPGQNPDIDIHRALTEVGSDHVAALYGWLEAPAPDGGPGLQLAMLQQFLRTGSDGWVLALASVRNLFSEADLHADEVGGDFAGEAERLGIAIAEVHETLREHFPTETWEREAAVRLADAMDARLEAAVKDAPALAPHAEGLRALFHEVRILDEPVLAQRVHGDLHLGQTLRTVRGWKIVDFEGEPAKPLADRLLPDSPWRDVAGMLRSFDYAAHAAERDVEGDPRQIAHRAREWSQRNRDAFLSGYLSVATPDKAEDVLLRAYEADKAVYETVYETRNRPTWVTIPLAAVAALSGGVG